MAVLTPVPAHVTEVAPRVARTASTRRRRCGRSRARNGLEACGRGRRAAGRRRVRDARCITSSPEPQELLQPPHPIPSPRAQSIHGQGCGRGFMRPSSVRMSGHLPCSRPIRATARRRLLADQFGLADIPSGRRKGSVRMTYTQRSCPGTRGGDTFSDRAGAARRDDASDHAARSRGRWDISPSRCTAHATPFEACRA